MWLEGKVQLIERKKLTDTRGWFLKIMDGKEKKLSPSFGEIYVTRAVPGEFRANHYHKLTSEWFTIIEGRAKVILEDIHTKERKELELTDETPQTLYCAPEIAHVFYNPDNSLSNFTLIAYADTAYDPNDTIPYKLV